VQKRTKELEEGIRELDKTAKLLVKRDFQLLQTNELLRETDKAKSRFVSIAAHQLRTPLSAIKWTLQMVLSGDFGKIGKKHSQVLQEALLTLERLVKLIGDLLNVARIESGQLQYTFSPIHMEEVAKKVFEESRVEAKSRGISLKLSLPKESLPPVSGDFQNLIVGLQNIVENALLYTPQGGKVEIIAQRALQEKMVQVSVKDTGMGIPAEQKSLIGQKFFRADNVIRRQVPGTGLGLYIVQRILEQHNGKLDIESKEGVGTTFSLALPILETPW
jgi:signal transduction histidine kinase